MNIRPYCDAIMSAAYPSGYRWPWMGWGMGAPRIEGYPGYPAAYHLVDVRVEEDELLEFVLFEGEWLSGVRPRY